MATPTNATLPSVVRSLEGRVERLIADHRRLCEVNRDLLEQRDTLQSSRRELQERIVELEKELALSQLRSGLEGHGQSNKRARAYINRLMREVDSCITLLSSPGAE